MSNIGVWAHDLEQALGVTMEEAERAGITLEQLQRLFTEEAERLSQKIEDDTLSLADRARCARSAIKALDLAERNMQFSQTGSRARSSAI